MKVQRKGEPPIGAVFCYGPFPPFDEADPNVAESSEEGEITVLTGCVFERQTVKSAVAIGQRNLEALRRDGTRRRTYARRIG
jgi:hypothetical protein